MDKFRIKYKCHTKPERESGLYGFEEHGVYAGRSYNELFEVCSKWGSGMQTHILRKKVFESYFEMQEQTKHHAEKISRYT